ncbi:hypothetical protein Sjap_018863 [Stephania japonica]|uniref:Auxin-responsive protein n=1 Tax=Stephania japonica TaxID=461633 RepID=A0AAP0I8U7_9MAGN
MSPPPLGVVEERQGNASIVSSSLLNGSLNSAELKERNYMGLSDCSSVDSCTASGFSDENKCSLNLKATELRLGLPGSHSPDRDEDNCMLSSGKLDEKPLFPLLPSKDGIFSSPQKTVASGNKRGFADAMDRSSEVKSKIFHEGKWVYPSDVSEPDTPQSAPHGKFPANAVGSALLPSRPIQNTVVSSKEHSGPQLPLPTETLQDRAHGVNQISTGQMTPANNNNTPPAAKPQVVGWPPIRSFRKNTLATTSKNNDEVDGKPSSRPLFVKVSMDGAPYLRKVDLRTYSKYQDLSSALENMFSGFTIGQCVSDCAAGKEPMNESKLRDLLHGAEHVLTYEDKDGDWMLVGDVPWEMFVDNCRRMRIMKSSDAIGLAPRAAEKCKTRN